MLAAFASSARTLLRRPLAVSAASALTIGTAASMSIAATGGHTSSLSSIAMLEPAASPFVRVVSYNVLSSHLCEPTHYIKCDPADLDPDTRRQRVQELLEPHMQKQAVVCLQEVSTQWLGELTPFFESRGYTFVCGNYGNPFNGYMGSALAWPTARFASEEVSITRVADSKPWPSPPKKEKRERSKWAIAFGGAWASIKTLWSTPKKPPFDVWHETKRRHNFLVSVNLRCKESGRPFSVSTYHMPCLFGTDPKVQVMTNHAALAAQAAQRFAGDRPCVLAGDFNFKPGDAPYRLITSGDLDAADPHMPPPPPHGDTWRPALPTAMESAYVLADGREPEFTNLASNAWGGDAFCETLDYIFLARGAGWRVRNVRPLPSKEEVVVKGGCVSYPIASEPSDHTMIWADLDLQ